MSNLLSVYWSVMHRLPKHYDYMKRLNPTVIKIMDGGQPDYEWVRQNVPGALVIARDWALSEQHDDMTGDPIGTGKRHAQEWDRHANRLGFDRAQTLVLGVNEPRVWEPAVSECLRLYTIAFLDECSRFGLRAGAMQLSVGWPANQGGDTPPDWTPFWGVEDAIKRGNHMLVLHEYWADLGPGEMWGWWGGRALKCPWQVPIVIGESGVDMYVKDASVEHAKRGWQGRMSPERYAAELREYTWRMAADSRFKGDCVFALDCADCATWGTFDVTPAIDAILATPPVTPSSAPVTVHLPIVGGNPTPQPEPQSDLFSKVMQFISRWEGGFVNHPNDPGGATNFGITIGTLSRWRGHSVTVDDVRNLTREEANQIYREYYWKPSGAADAKDYPTALLLMDSGVLHGVGAPQAWVKEYGLDPWRIAARRLRVYTGKDGAQWNAFGRGWTNRVADLLTEIGGA